MGKRKNRDNAFLRHMTGLLGEAEARELIASLSKPAAKSVRYNRRLLQSSAIIPDSEPVPWCLPWGRYWDHSDLPSRTLEFAAGHYYIQEASAMLAIEAASKVIDFKGKRIIDLTAAPGGKTTQAAELSENGYVIANEVVSKRVDAVLWNVNRHRLDNVIISSIPTAELAALLPGFFDIVIVDAPCSGEGLFQRGKQSLSDWSVKHVRYCSKRQQRILTDAVALTKPGGYLIYSTCTFSQEENEDQIENLLTLGLQPVTLPGPDDLPVSQAVSTNKAILSCSRRIFPHREKGAGAFLAVLQQTNAHTPPLPPHQHAVEKSLSVPQGLAIQQGNSDYLYEQNGVVCLFNQSSIPSVLRDRAVQLGAPLYDKRRDNALMFGAVQRPDPERIISLDHNQAHAYIRGEKLTLPYPDGWYFVSFHDMVLGPVFQSGDITDNHFPRPLQTKYLK